MTSNNDSPPRDSGGNLTQNALHKAIIKALATAPAAAINDLIKQYPRDAARIRAAARAVGIELKNE